MLKELLVYGIIFAQSSIDFIKSFAEVNDDDELVARINTDGGDVLYGWGMIAKFIEHKGPKTVKVDGKAYSMGAYFCAYADNVEALDVSQFMIHRAGYSAWFENSEYFTDELKTNLEEVNKQLKAALKNKIDVAKLESLKGIKFNDIFSMDGRIDVFLNAKEAKQIGLINKITKITPKRMNAINSEMTRIAATFTGVDNIEPTVATIEDEQVKLKNKTMTVEEFKAAHPEAYKAIQKGAVKKEQDRVNAWLKFNDIDAKAVAEGIESGDDLSQTAMAEFSKKMFSAQALEKIEKDGADPVETPEGKSTPPAKKTELEIFEAKVNVDLGLNSEND
ncbi:MAG: ATP-dependent Clp protease proteolytic subunit [Phycisphaerales bacterium]|nr:ATP-dependent Clp protease proteolytic subunit [Phycisphaerales bacterium]